MGQIINLNAYLDKKSITDLEDSFDRLDFSDPTIVKELVKNLYINYITLNKEIISTFQNNQSSLQLLKDNQDQHDDMLNKLALAVKVLQETIK